MQTFEQALREQIAANKMRRFRAKRLLKVLDAKPSAKRTRILDRLEAHAAGFMTLEGVALVRADGGVGAIDWGAIDWAKFFYSLLKFLLALLPLFI